MGVNKMIKAQLKIPKNKSREADVRITKLIDEGIIKSVSYGPELKPTKGKRKRAPSKYNIFMGKCIKRKSGPIKERFKSCATEYKKRK